MTSYIIREMEVKYKSFKKTKIIPIGSPENVYEFFKKLQNEAQEKFITIYLNNKNEIICFSNDFIGSSKLCDVDIKVIIRNALMNMAEGIIIVHNHPSGSIEPSCEDIELSQNIQTAAKLFNIKLLDSVIIGYNSYYSLRREGKI